MLHNIKTHFFTYKKPPLQIAKWGVWKFLSILFQKEVYSLWFIITLLSPDDGEIVEVKIHSYIYNIFILYI